MSDDVFELVRHVLATTIHKPKTALLKDTAKQIRTFRGLRVAEQKSTDMVDIEVAHLQVAALKIEQALLRLKRIPTTEGVGLKETRTLKREQVQISWVADLKLIKDDIEARMTVIHQGSGAPIKRSPVHIGLAVMGALERGNVPMRNWRTLTATLLEKAAALPSSEATTGARYARDWMAKRVAK